MQSRINSISCLISIKKRQNETLKGRDKQRKTFAAISKKKLRVILLREKSRSNLKSFKVLKLALFPVANEDNPIKGLMNSKKKKQKKNT